MFISFTSFQYFSPPSTYLSLMSLLQHIDRWLYAILFTIHLTLISTRYTWTHMSAYECNWMYMKSHSSSWYDLQVVVGDIATTSLAANDSQFSNDLLVLHSFQEECWQSKVDLQYLAQKIFNRDLQLSGFLNLPLF